MHCTRRVVHPPYGLLRYSSRSIRSPLDQVPAHHPHTIIPVWYSSSRVAAGGYKVSWQREEVPYLGNMICHQDRICRGLGWPGPQRYNPIDCSSSHHGDITQQDSMQHGAVVGNSPLRECALRPARTGLLNLDCSPKLILTFIRGQKGAKPSRRPSAAECAICSGGRHFNTVTAATWGDEHSQRGRHWLYGMYLLVVTQPLQGEHVTTYSKFSSATGLCPCPIGKRYPSRTVHRD